MNRENKWLPDYLAGSQARGRMHFASGSAPASGAANRAFAVGTERCALTADRETVSGEGLFHEGAEDGGRGRLRSPQEIMSRDGGLTESMRSISLSINTAVTRPTILACVIEPSNNNKS